jgi:hypothetical protein
MGFQMQLPMLPRRAAGFAAAASAVALLAGCTGPAKQVAHAPLFSATLDASIPKLAFLQYFSSAAPNCMTQLQHSKAFFIPLPDIKTPQGCGYQNAVLVLAIGDVALTGPAILQCQAALRLTQWVTRDVQPAAQTLLGTRVKKIKVSDHYNCRLKGGRSLVPTKKRRRAYKPPRRRMSEHAFANAVDVSRMWFANDQESHVMLDWHGPMRGARVSNGVMKMKAESEEDLRQGVLVAFWRTVAKRACDRFTKVLTPEFNWMHRHHIHLDLSPGKRCALDGTVAGVRRYAKRRRSSKRRYRNGRRYTASSWQRVRAKRYRKGRRAVYIRARKRIIRGRK